jgi:hypothetical protein
MRRESGVAMRAKRFLRAKRVGERVVSARRAVVKVRVVRARPMMVRYWRCQP